MIRKFKKKQIIIEAIQFNGRNGQEIQLLMDITSFTPTCWGTLFIQTLEGTMEAQPKDWIIKGIKGEFYPCKPDIFEASYEELLK